MRRFLRNICGSLVCLLLGIVIGAVARANHPASRSTRAWQIEQGRRWFKKFGCVVCHAHDGREGLGPTLLGKYGTVARLEGGRRICRDRRYFRKKILFSAGMPLADGFNVMPIYRSSISSSQLEQIITYIRSLSRHKHCNKRLRAVIKPTSRPTSRPTSQPTSRPTSRPTSQPTSRPTSQPTSRPTSQPTSRPTSRP